MAQRKSDDLRWPATSSSTIAVITYELSCQLQSELLQVLMDVFWAEVLLENISICNCHVEKEEGDVFVELSTLGSTGVVPTKLVSTIHTPMYLLYKRIDSGQRTGVRVWSFCRRRTDAVEDGWELLNIAITTFLSNQAHALTPPFWTTCESPLLGKFMCCVCGLCVWMDAYMCWCMWIM